MCLLFGYLGGPFGRSSSYWALRYPNPAGVGEHAYCTDCLLCPPRLKQRNARPSWQRNISSQKQNRNTMDGPPVWKLMIGRVSSFLSGLRLRSMERPCYEFQTVPGPRKANIRILEGVQGTRCRVPSGESLL